MLDLTFNVTLADERERGYWCPYASGRASIFAFGSVTGLAGAFVSTNDFVGALT